MKKALSLLVEVFFQRIVFTVPSVALADYTFNAIHTPCMCLHYIASTFSQLVEGKQFSKRVNI